MPRLPLDSIVLQRDSGPRCLVLVHGYGEPASDLTDRLSLIDPDRRFVVVVPTAPYERKGRRIWHRPMSSPEEAEAQYVGSLGALDHLLGEIHAQLGISAADTVVGGFSQGGGVSMGLLIGADVRHRPAAAFGVCSFPPMVSGFRVDRAAARGRRYFLASAEDDHFAPIEISRQGARAVRDLGVDLTYVELAGGHVMSDAAAGHIGAWLSGSTAATQPAGSSDPLADVAPRTYEGFWEFV